MTAGHPSRGRPMARMMNSFDLFAWAWRQPCESPSEQVVLAALASDANHTMTSWLPQGDIAQMTKQSVDSVGRRIRDLEAKRLLRTVPLKFGGRKTADFIILAPSPFFEATLEQIDVILPRGCEIDPKWLALNAPADRGDDEPGTGGGEDEGSAGVEGDQPPDPPLPQNAGAAEITHEADALNSTLPQNAGAVAATVREQDKESKTTSMFNRNTVESLTSRAPDEERNSQVSATPSTEKEQPSKQEIVGSGVAIQPFTRAWFAVAWKRVERGAPVNFMFSEGVAGKSWSILASQLPTDIEERSLIPIKVDGPEYAEWKAWMAERGHTLPRPTKVPVIFVPSAWPPGFDLVQRAEAAGEPAMQEAVP